MPKRASEADVRALALRESESSSSSLDKSFYNVKGAL